MKLAEFGSDMLYGLNFTMKTLVERLREIVIKDVAVREAMLKVDRADFCPVDPYFDSPGDIGYGATISAPHMHAYALQNAYSRVLEAKPDGRILDVGSGSGYLTACFAYLTKGLVVGVEHVPELVADSITNIRKHHQDLLDQGRVKIVVGDGRKGCPLDALFAVIHVGAASPEIPQTVRSINDLIVTFHLV